MVDLDGPVVQAEREKAVKEFVQTDQQWSRPMGPTELARKFRVCYNTMKKYLQEQSIPNEKLPNSRFYRIPLHKLPADQRKLLE